MNTALLDCAVVGGGPAGLTAALYLARYRRTVIMYDMFCSRAERIPITHNYPGFPQGISGKDLLNRMRQQLSYYNVPLIQERVESLQQINEHFLVKTGNNKVYARNIILATGAKDIEPQLVNINDGIQRGLIRHCPVCDAYEVINKKIAIIGDEKSALREALFLRDFSPHISLINLGKKNVWTKIDLQKIHKAKIRVIAEEILEINLQSDAAKIKFATQEVILFDCIYSALGSIKNDQLAMDLGAKKDKKSLLVNKNQQTSVKGLFAVGDVISGLNQICVATSQAAIAATAINIQCQEFS